MADLNTIFKENFIEYGMETIEDRAVPDIRDGLKPVHRASIYECFQSRATSDKPFVKVARISGSVIGKWHPHGDKAVEDAMVGLSVEWKNPLPILDIKGNNGSIYGDPAAAGRYIETKLTKAGDAYGEWLSPKIVPYTNNYDDTLQMPTVLPAQIPYLLINGAEGIAVGLACSIPPHNPKQVMDTVIHYMKEPKSSTAELLTTLEGPDFPTGGSIINKSDLLTMYETGKGRIRSKGDVQYDVKTHALHVTAVPYNYSGSVDNLVAELTIASMETTDSKTNKKKPPKIKGIKSVENMSGKDGIDIEIKLMKGINADNIIKEIYAKTGLETTYSFNFTALNDKQVSIYNLKRYLHEYVVFQNELVINKSQVELERIYKRLEVIKGLLLMQNVIDEVIYCAKHSKGKEELVQILQTGQTPFDLPKGMENVKTFQFTEIQARHIAELQIHRISRMDTNNLIIEGRELDKEQLHFTQLINDDAYRQSFIIDYHAKMAKSMNTPRQTVICDEERSTVTKLETPEIPLYVSMDQYNYVSIQEKPFEDSIKTSNKERLSFLDKEGVLWNTYLDTMKPTTGRGVLVNQLIDTDDIVGMVTLPNEAYGLFVYDRGSAKRLNLNDFMTKQRATKVTSSKNAHQLIAFSVIPNDATHVTINDKRVALDNIPIQGLKGSGKLFIKPTDNVTITWG